jgi:purine-binding chemotaxis protein CheW
MSVNKPQKAVVTFRLADQYYALPIMNVLEVAAMMTLSKIPNAPEALLGMVNRHGEALPMLDLRTAFNLAATPPDESTLFIVAQNDTVQIGLVVDEIFQVKYLNEAAFKSAQAAGRYITHIISDGQTLYQQIGLKALLADYLTHIQS